MKEINIAIVGATGMVGTKFLQVLTERKLPIKNYYLYASKKSAGKLIDFMGSKHTVLELTEENILGKNINYALFSAGGGITNLKRLFYVIFFQLLKYSYKVIFDDHHLFFTNYIYQLFFLAYRLYNHLHIF